MSSPDTDTPGSPPDTWIVIPCFNEALRLDQNQIAELLSVGGPGIVLVDDGSEDETGAMISAIVAANPGRAEMLRMIDNVGKAESVRRGMNHAHALGASITGYLDADFATPASEMLRLVSVLKADTSRKVLLASRWLHMGSQIRRSQLRHYAGRVFATFASIMLGMPVYDTQCGAKLFRVTENLLDALDEPFISRWAFDVELIGRLREGIKVKPGYAVDEFIEIPLSTWVDVRGSKINVFDMIKTTLELVPIATSLRRLR